MDFAFSCVSADVGAKRGSRRPRPALLPAEMTESPILSFSEIIRHWLLNTVVEFGVPLTSVFPVAGHGLNVKPIPGCTSDDYAKALLELFDSGLVRFSSRGPGSVTGNRDGILRILDRCRVLSKDDLFLRANHRLLTTHRLSKALGMQVYFELTPLGGDAWEKIAQPDWTRYLSTSTVFPVIGAMTGECELISADRDLMIAYMGWYPEVSGEQIQMETVTWQAHTDFKIVYWKRIPFVHHASFQVQSVNQRWIGEIPRWFQDRWISSQSWYTKPWDLHGWPTK